MIEVLADRRYNRVFENSSKGNGHYELWEKSARASQATIALKIFPSLLSRCLRERSFKNKGVQRMPTRWWYISPFAAPTFRGRGTDLRRSEQETVIVKVSEPSVSALCSRSDCPRTFGALAFFPGVRGHAEIGRLGVHWPKRRRRIPGA